MMSTEVYLHIQQMKITINENTFILPYSRLYCTVVDVVYSSVRSEEDLEELLKFSSFISFIIRLLLLRIMD